MARCTELTAVFDDGTVKRWEGSDLACKLPMPEIYDAPCVGDRVEDLREAKHTTTKPLRRVTVLRGRHYSDQEGDYIERHHDEALRFAEFDGRTLGDATDHRTWQRTATSIALMRNARRRNG